MEKYYYVINEDEDVTYLMEKSGCSREEVVDFLRYSDIFLDFKEIPDDECDFKRISKKYGEEMHAFIAEKTGMSVELSRRLYECYSKYLDGKDRLDMLFFTIQMIVINLIFVLAVIRVAMEFM